MILSNFFIDLVRYPTVLISLLIILILSVLAISAPYLGLNNPSEMTTNVYIIPNSEYLMGTDNFGRDIFSRTIWGTRLAFQVAIITSLFSTFLGIILGSISGYYGGIIDQFLSRVFDVFLLIPAFFLVILIVALFGSNIYLIISAIAITHWSGQARIMRSQVLTIKTRIFVQASIGMGASKMNVLFRHIVPNGIAPLITNGTILMGFAILSEAGLSFLGLGDQSTISWGRMIYEGQQQLRLAPWIVIFPGISMLLLVAALNLIGDGLNQALDPKLRRRGNPKKNKLNFEFIQNIEKLPNYEKSVSGEKTKNKLLEVTNLKMFFSLRDNWIRAVDDITFSINNNSSLGIVGESGCGKSSLCLTLMQVLPQNAKIFNGSIRFSGEEIIDSKIDKFKKIRWKQQSMIFQSAMNALNPVIKVRQQLYETLHLHNHELNDNEKRKRVEEIIDMVGIPKWRLESYPHELSGGMRQRIMIALSLLLNPKLIIADEPCTALDVIVQDQIMGELEELISKHNLSLLLISHDIGSVAETCENIGVMYAGQIVEIGSTKELFSNPRHPYTKALINAQPNISGPKHKLTSLPGVPFLPIGEIIGCRFAPRCSYATEICVKEEPNSMQIKIDHFSKCHFALDEILNY